MLLFVTLQQLGRNQGGTTSVCVVVAVTTDDMIYKYGDVNTIYREKPEKSEQDRRSNDSAQKWEEETIEGREEPIYGG